MCPLVKVLCHFVLHTPALFEVLRPTGDAVAVLPTHHAARCHGHAWSLACHVTVTVSYIVQNYVLQSCFTHFLLKTPARVAPTATTIIYATYVCTVHSKACFFRLLSWMSQSLPQSTEQSVPRATVLQYYSSCSILP